MRLNLTSTATLFADVHAFPDPWGVGVTFHVRRWNSREHQDWLKARERRHPVGRAVISGVVKRVLADRKPAVVEGAAEEEEEAPARRSTGEIYQEVLDQAVSAGELDPHEVASYVFGGGSADLERDEAISLLEDWEGVIDYDAGGGEVKCTPKAARAVLSDESVVEGGRPFAGQTVGDALVAHIRDCSRQIEAYRRDQLEGAAGNSGSGSGGDGSSGPRRTKSSARPSKKRSGKGASSPN